MRNPGPLTLRRAKLELTYYGADILRNPGPLTLQFFGFSEIKCLECEQYSHIAQLAKEGDYEI